ncbi:MAG TPA: TonB family protein [Rhodocyclaceae bacterium]|nr:TonB family protein [Rhodocyclaceae bacterium]
MFARIIPAWRRRSARLTFTLPTAFTISLVLHALLFTVHFRMPATNKVAKDRQLEIVLVNAKSAHKPRDAQTLAQANLDGGGDRAEPVRAKTPLPSVPKLKAADDLADLTRRVQELETKQKKLVEAARSPVKLPSERAPAERTEPAPNLSGMDLATRALAMARMEAEIARRMENYNQRPRRRYIGSRAEEYRFAQYIEDWRTKIERIGNLNYPEAARGKLYGSLRLTVAIRADGDLERVELNHSSGHKVLDDAAVRIVRLAAPYAPFPPEISRDTDILEITRTWTFTSSDRVRSE